MKIPSVNMNGQEITLYEFFGVKKDAPADELKRVYRDFCMKYHPDKNQENRELAEENFKVIQNVWGILGNSSKRAEYDRMLDPVQNFDFTVSVTYGYNSSTTAW